MLFHWGKPPKEGFPKGFSPQSIAISGDLAHLPPAHLAQYFLDHPETAKRLLVQSYDKRFTPSTFITEDGDKFKVGWFSKQLKYESVREFTNLADATTDYVLFSLGIGRWTPLESKD